jgi:DNA adenine methylase
MAIPTNFTAAYLLRYPGSKRPMLEFLGRHLPRLDDIQGRYIEPFVGSGAVFFLLSPRNALLSDINPDLIDLYRGIRSSPSAVWTRYVRFGSRKADYNRIRDAGSGGLIVDRAARVLFLNRTCFNGMWRHNRDGQFNVGYGGQDRRWAIDQATLTEVAGKLRRARLRCCDFEAVIESSESGEFIFLDPPYRPGELELEHIHYRGKRFTFFDHQRLAKALLRARRRGVHWALTTSSHPDILALFSRCNITSVPRGTGSRPGTRIYGSGEVLITSYVPRGEA